MEVVALGRLAEVEDTVAANVTPPMRVRVQKRQRENYDHTRVLHDEDDRVCETVEDVVKVLADLDFAPSCVDMEWEFDVEDVFVRPADAFGEAVDPAGYRIRTTFRRPDRDTGEIRRGEGRWWEVPLRVTESGVVKTAFAAAKLILEHELMESFKWKGVRVFDPHHSVRELAAIHPGRYNETIP